MADYIDWETGLGLPSESIDDEIKGTDELKLSNRLYKVGNTAEEIERFTVDESMGDVDRALYILKHGANVQKHSVVNSLPNLLHEHTSESRTRVLPALLDTIATEPKDFQIAVGKGMLQLMERGLLPPKTVQMVAGVARKLMDGKDSETVQVWSDILILAIKFMPLDVIENEILPEALLDGGLAQPSPFRLWCCRVLGAVATRMEGKKAEDLFFRKAMTLCQDTDYEVRACMCRQLNAIARAVGLNLTKSALLPEYTELLTDEEDVVREAAIENLMTLLEFLDGDAKVRIVMPQWKKLCDERPPRILTLIAKELGGFMWQTKDQMSDSDTKWFVGFFQSIAASAVPEQREMCAFNFPAILKCVGAEGWDAFKLYRTFDSLATDECVAVRRRIAGGFHEVAAILAPNMNACLQIKPIFVKLLSDTEVEVFHASVKNTDQILGVFTAVDRKHSSAPNLSSCLSNAASNPAHSDLLFQLLRRERECATTQSRSWGWRVHMDLVAQFAGFTDHFEAERVNDLVVPALFKLLADNVVIPIKKVVITCLCQYLRKMRRAEHRDRIYRQMQGTQVTFPPRTMVHGFCVFTHAAERTNAEIKDAPSYHQRMLYLQICETVLQMFSHKYFRDHFIQGYLTTAQDRVPNIRLRFIGLLPQVRKVIRIPADSTLLHTLTETVSGLAMGDTDRDVAAVAAEAYAAFGGAVGGGAGIASRAAAA
ncbi:Serine/threonine-protein phosphatase 4 regulatory subunit 4, partial [Borealophlyctis nickersoniae]